MRCLVTTSCTAFECTMLVRARGGAGRCARTPNPVPQARVSASCWVDTGSFGTMTGLFTLSHGTAQVWSASSQPWPQVHASNITLECRSTLKRGQ